MRNDLFPGEATLSHSDIGRPIRETPFVKFRDKSLPYVGILTGGLGTLYFFGDMWVLRERFFQFWDEFAVISEQHPTILTGAFVNTVDIFCGHNLTLLSLLQSVKGWRNTPKWDWECSGLQSQHHGGWGLPWFQHYPGPESESQASLLYIRRPCLRQQQSETVFIVTYTYLKVQKLIMRKQQARICVNKYRDSKGTKNDSYSTINSTNVYWASTKTQTHSSEKLN